jgi:hypothetical protein
MVAARVLLFCSLMMLAGCGSKPAALNQVTGKVLYKGVPVTSGIIVFSPDTARGENGKIAVSRISEDGSYTLRTGDAAGVAAGWYRVTVASVSPPTDPAYDSPATSLLPDKYRDPQLSQLQCEVKSNHDNHLNFNLD